MPCMRRFHAFRRNNLLLQCHIKGRQTSRRVVSGHPSPLVREQSAQAEHTRTQKIRSHTHIELQDGTPGGQRADRRGNDWDIETTIEELRLRKRCYDNNSRKKNEKLLRNRTHEGGTIMQGYCIFAAVQPFMYRAHQITNCRKGIGGNAHTKRRSETILRCYHTATTVVVIFPL